MKRKYIIILIVILLITGCGKNSSRNDILLDKYETAYGELIENDTFLSSSDLFDLELIVTKLPGDEFRVDLILDNPQMAMYKVEMLMELDPTGGPQYDEILPSLGIVDDTQYNLIPFQSNVENGFYSGLVLSAITKQESGTLTLMVKWSDYAATKSFDQFIKLEYSEKDLVDEETIKDGTNE